MQKRLYIHRDSGCEQESSAYPHFTVLSLFAAVTEFLQLVSVDRNPFVTDWLFDLIGILMGILLACFFAKIPKLRKILFSENNGADPH